MKNLGSTLRPRSWNIPNPIGIHRLHESNSEPCEQCQINIFFIKKGPKRSVSIFLRNGLGTTRFHILHARLLKGCQSVNGTPAKIQNTTRPDSIWSKVLETNRKRSCRMGRKMTNCKQHATTRLLQGDR